MLPALLFLLSACAPSQRPPNVADLDVDVHLPPVETFVFGPGDKVFIFVWRHEDLSLEVGIAPDGYITYPLLGRIKVAGTTYEELVHTLQLAINEYYVDAKVAVNITEVQSQKVLVMGEVAMPQVIPLTQQLSVLEAVTRAGGINPDSNTRNVLVVRGGLADPLVFTVDLHAVITQGDMSQMIFLQKGDIVYVPSSTITNVERFFRHFQAILAPAVGGSAIYRNVISGGAQGTSSALE
jgi:polysaccharide export outer membrane protein